MAGLTREDLVRHLRDALKHLHDADYLRHSPLATLFGLAHRLDASLALRSILTDAIDSLKPAAEGPPASREWQMHDALYCYYVQRLSQQVVADQLAVSVRQLRREQAAALEALADHLCEQFDLEARLHGVSGSVVEDHFAPPRPAISEELAWLKHLPPEEPTDLQETLAEVLLLVEPLAAQRGARVLIRTPDGLPKLAVHPVALIQILVGLLRVVISQTRGPEIHISIRPLERSVHVDLRGAGAPSGHSTLSDEDTASLEVARQLAGMCGGTVNVAGEERDAFEVTVELPALECLPVLVIDDNADTLQLLQRYTVGTRYRVIGARDPKQALELAETVRPEIIVLDVMMPQVDGWRLLGRLRQHPRTGHIPLVVCTILPEEALALSLGASAFVRKPVTRQALLAALDGQAVAGKATR